MWFKFINLLERKFCRKLNMEFFFYSLRLLFFLALRFFFLVEGHTKFLFKMLKSFLYLLLVLSIIFPQIFSPLKNWWISLIVRRRQKFVSSESSEVSEMSELHIHTADFEHLLHSETVYLKITVSSDDGH